MVGWQITIRKNDAFVRNSNVAAQRAAAPSNARAYADVLVASSACLCHCNTRGADQEDGTEKSGDTIPIPGPGGRGVTNRYHSPFPINDRFGAKQTFLAAATRTTAFDPKRSFAVAPFRRSEQINQHAKGRQ